MNLDINKQEYEKLIDMCSMAMTIVHYCGDESSQEFEMSELFNKILSLNTSGEEMVTDERIDRLYCNFFRPYLDNFKKKLDEVSANAVEVNEVVEAVDVQVAEEITDNNNSFR